jgi:CBS domain-containing protein
MNVLEADAEKIKVEQIMTPTRDLIIMSPDRHADEALKRIYQENKGRVFVCTSSPPKLTEQQISEQKGEINSSGEINKNQKKEMLQKEQQHLKLIGIISKTDILNIATERQEYEREVRRSSATTNFNREG